MYDGSLVPTKIIKHLVKIIDMYLDKEEKHYEEDCFNDNDKDHIFHDLLAISHWIKENHTMKEIK